MTKQVDASVPALLSTDAKANIHNQPDESVPHKRICAMETQVCFEIYFILKFWLTIITHTVTQHLSMVFVMKHSSLQQYRYHEFYILGTKLSNCFLFFLHIIRILNLFCLRLPIRVKIDRAKDD